MIIWIGIGIGFVVCAIVLAVFIFVEGCVHIYRLNRLRRETDEARQRLQEFKARTKFLPK